jgi:hypothetical protein
MPQDLESERIEMLWGKFDACQGHHYRGERFSSKYKKGILFRPNLAPSAQGNLCSVLLAF